MVKNFLYEEKTHSCMLKDDESKKDIFKITRDNNKFLLFYEDRIKIPHIYNGKKTVGNFTSDQIRQMNHCGVNFIKFDKVTPRRLENLVWSWEKGYPKNLTKAANCTYQNKKSRWKNENCSVPKFVVCASSDKDYESLHISDKPMIWQQAKSYCRNINLQFIMPITARANYIIHQHKKI